MPKTKNNKIIGLVALTALIWLVHFAVYKNGANFVVNSGISFGIYMPIAWMLALLLCLGSIIWVIKGKNWGWMIILSGGWVNYIDRIVHGGVYDYWQIPGTQIYNNIADWMIFIGVVTAIIQSINTKNG